jgi:flavin-dependent dehydrogenase
VSRISDLGGRRFDVVVVGAGPCGSVLAARLASGGVRVLLLEATAFEQARMGEFVSPQAQSMLNGLALLESGWEREHRYVSEFVSAWGSQQAVSRNYIFDAYGRGLVLDRVKFNRGLARVAVSRGARLVTRARLNTLERSAGGWQLVIDRKGTKFAVHCGFLVLCSGRSSRPPQILAIARQRLDRLVCLGLRVSNYDGEDFPCVESYSEGWVYSAKLPSGELIVNVFVDPDLRAVRTTGDVREFLLKEVANCPTSASRLLRTNPTTRSDVTFFATDASSTLQRPAVGVGWCIAGDCAQTVDPLSSGGIGHALEHAKLISDTVLRSASCESIDLSEYAAHLTNSYANYLTARSHFYGLEHRWCTTFWQRRVQARPVIF